MSQRRNHQKTGWVTHIYLGQIHFDIWQNQYNIVKLKNKIKKNILNLLSYNEHMTYLNLQDAAKLEKS